MAERRRYTPPIKSLGCAPEVDASEALLSTQSMHVLSLEKRLVSLEKRFLDLENMLMVTRVTGQYLRDDHENLHTWVETLHDPLARDVSMLSSAMDRVLESLKTLGICVFSSEDSSDDSVDKEASMF